MSALRSALHASVVAQALGRARLPSARQLSSDVARLTCPLAAQGPHVATAAVTVQRSPALRAIVASSLARTPSQRGLSAASLLMSRIPSQQLSIFSRVAQLTRAEAAANGNPLDAHAQGVYARLLNDVKKHDEVCGVVYGCIRAAAAPSGRRVA